MCGCYDDRTLLQVYDTISLRLLYKTKKSEFAPVFFLPFTFVSVVEHQRRTTHTRTIPGLAQHPHMHRTTTTTP